MKKSNNQSLEEKCDEILSHMSPYFNNDQKMRYLYHELCLIFAKNTEYFYEYDNQTRQEIYDNYTQIDNYEVICRSVVYQMEQLALKSGLDCRPISSEGVDGVTHWSLVYYNNNKRYLMNPMPDFYRVQMGFSTKHFCCVENYYGYDDGMPFDTMSPEYLRELDKSLGYLSGDLYTDELLEKLRVELQLKLGMHIVHTTDVYQDYYLKMLQLNQDDSLSLDEKLEQIKPLDPQYEKHIEIIRKNLENKTIDKDMKKLIHNLAFKLLEQNEFSLDRKREGAKYIGTIDIKNINNLKKDILTYKFNYMLNCLTTFTDSLTGYIEHKNFMDELIKYIFTPGEERRHVKRHTVVQDDNNEKQYYMMLSLTVDDSNNKIYSFYNHNDKKVEMKIEPLSYMIKHNIRPLKDSSLNSEFDYDFSCMELPINKPPKK